MTHLRSDAQRNLGRVLEAAAEVFAERGPAATVDEIARRAGVGHATVFRRFPTKDALIAAVAQERLRELVELARAALDADDPGAAFEAFVLRMGELNERGRGLVECADRCMESQEGVELHELGARLVARAQRAGAMRDDVTAADVEALVGSAMRAAPPGEWRRYVEIVLAGLRPAS